MVDKLPLAGVEDRPNDFRAPAVHTIDTISSVMIQYTDEHVDFLLQDYLVAVIKLWLEKEFGRECRNCGNKDRSRHVDHVVPTPHDYRSENLQLLCDVCHKEVRHSSPTLSLTAMPFVHVPTTLPKQKTSREKNIMRNADVNAFVHGLQQEGHVAPPAVPPAV